MTNPDIDKTPITSLDTPPTVPPLGGDAQTAYVNAGNKMFSEVPFAAPPGGATLSMDRQAVATPQLSDMQVVTGVTAVQYAPFSGSDLPAPLPISANDAPYSVDQLVALGAMRQVDALPASGQDAAADGKQERAAEQQLEQTPRTDSVDNIKVVLSDQDNDPSQRANDPDFRIRTDGTIECLHDPETTNKKELVVEVERKQGDVGPATDAQKNAVDGLVGYLSNRFMEAKNDGTRDGAVDDQQGMMSDQARAATGTPPAPEQELPQPTRQQIDNMNRFSGGGRGTLSPEQVENYFPKRDVPRDEGESVRTVAMKDVIAGMGNVGEQHPYESTQKFGDRGFGVGRYLLTYDMLQSWMDDLIGNPPDPAKLAELAKSDPKLAALLESQGFKHLLEKLKHGEQPTAEDIKNGLPKEMQEKVASQLIQKYANETKDADGNVDAGKVALAFHLGHAPTDAEMQKPANQSFVAASDKLFGIAEYHAERPGQSMDWQDVKTDGKDQNSKILLNARAAVGKPIWANSKFSASDLEYGNLGCAASVSEVFRAAGVTGVYSASVDGLEKQLRAKGYTYTRNPGPSDVAIFTKGGVDHHVGIMDANNQVLNNSSASKVFRSVDLNAEMRAGGFTGVKFLHKDSDTADA